MKDKQLASKEYTNASELKATEAVSPDNGIVEFPNSRKPNDGKITSDSTSAQVEESKRSKIAPPQAESAQADRVQKPKAATAITIMLTGIVSFVAKTIQLTCLLIITICSVAFIYFEYQPDSSLRATPFDQRSNSIDPRCRSGVYTDLYKTKFLNCK